ncbi:RsmH [Acrasis kona]|uniref:RsmH n=1 Tax=Acrasis kona TaxID=1008807 RepID=A0AAW2YNM8_9EUKA
MALRSLKSAAPFNQIMEQFSGPSGTLSDSFSKTIKEAEKRVVQERIAQSVTEASTGGFDHNRNERGPREDYDQWIFSLQR